MNMKKTFPILTLLILLAGCSGNAGNTAPTFDDVLMSRRSIRNFDASRTISEAEVRTLFAAAQEAGVV